MKLCGKWTLQGWYKTERADKKMKKVKLLMILGLVLGLILPQNALASYYDLYGPQAVRNDKVVNLGTLEMYLDSGRLKAGDSAVFSLPADFEFRNQNNELMTDSDWEFYQKNTVVYVGSGANYFAFPASLNGEANGLYQEEEPPFQVEQINSNEILFTVNSEPEEGLACYFRLELGQIYIPKDYWGEVGVVLEVDGDSGFIALQENDTATDNPETSVYPTLNPSDEPKPAAETIQAEQPEPTPLLETPVETKAEVVGFWAKLQQLMESVYQSGQ